MLLRVTAPPVNHERATDRWQTPTHIVLLKKDGDDGDGGCDDGDFNICSLWCSAVLARHAASTFWEFTSYGKANLYYVTL